MQNGSIMRSTRLRGPDVVFGYSRYLKILSEGTEPIKQLAASNLIPRIRIVVRHRPNEVEPCSTLCEKHPNQLGRIAPT